MSSSFKGIEIDNPGIIEGLPLIRNPSPESNSWFLLLKLSPWWGPPSLQKKSFFRKTRKLKILIIFNSLFGIQSLKWFLENLLRNNWKQNRSLWNIAVYQKSVWLFWRSLERKASLSKRFESFRIFQSFSKLLQIAALCNETLIEIFSLPFQENFLSPSLGLLGTRFSNVSNLMDYEFR